MFNAVRAPFIGAEYGGDTQGKGWVLFNDVAANIPDGWAEVEEMRGRTAIGKTNGTDAQFDTIGNTGGSKTQTLNASQIPQLSINIPKSSADNGEVGANRAIVSDLEPQGNITVTAGSATPQPVTVLNPYRIVMYIKWVGLP